MLNLAQFYTLLKVFNVQRGPSPVNNFPVGYVHYSPTANFTVPSVFALIDVTFDVAGRNLYLFPITSVPNGLGFFVNNLAGPWFQILSNNGSQGVMGTVDPDELVYIYRADNFWRAYKVVLEVNGLVGSHINLNFMDIFGNSVSKPNIITANLTTTFFTMTNPLADGTMVVYNGSREIILPAMNSPDNSLPAGGRIYFYNSGTAFANNSVYYADGTSPAFTLRTQYAVGILRDNSTANGVMDMYPIVNYGNTNLQFGTTYTVTKDDIFSTIIMSNAAANTVTIPSGLPVNFQCAIVWGGTGQTTIAQGTGVTVAFKDYAAGTTSAKLRTKNSAAYIRPTISGGSIFLCDGDFQL